MRRSPPNTLIAKLLDQHLPYDDLVRSLATNEIVREWLLRSFDINDIDLDLGDFRWAGNENEMKLLKQLNFSDMYRGAGRKFYDAGSSNSRGRDFPTLTAPGIGVVNTYGMDVYQIRQYIDRMIFDRVMGPQPSSIANFNSQLYYPMYTLLDSLEDTHNDVLVFRHAKDSHATIIVCIMGEEEPKQPVVFYTIHSEAQSAYSTNIRKRLNPIPWGGSHLNATTFFIGDTDRKMVSTFSNSLGWHISEDVKHEFLIHDITTPIYEVSMRKNIPVVEYPLGLQVDNMDKNCQLYAATLGNAIVDVFRSNTSLLRRIRNDPTHTSTSFIRELKRHVPMYYYPNGTQRSSEDIRRYHLKTRWDMDTRLITRALGEL